MDFTHRTPQLLQEDHRQTIATLEALEQMIVKARRQIPDSQDPKIRTVLRTSSAMIDTEIRGHFAFEETELFPRLEAAGDVHIGTHLREEHHAMLPLGEELANQATTALAEGFTKASWTAFRAAAAELIERMLAHIQKEEMALLPLLDDLLTPEADMALSQAYSEAG